MKPFGVYVKTIYMKIKFLALLSFISLAHASGELGQTQAPLGVLSTLAPVNIVQPPAANHTFSPQAFDAHYNPDTLKFDLYEYQKVQMAVEEEKKAISEMPQQPLVIVVNQPPPPPEPVNPVAEVLKFGLGVLSRGLLRF